jgi:hypothetical protein
MLDPIVSGWTGHITNLTGFYIEALTRGDANYSIYTEGASNGARFGHQLALVGTTDVQQFTCTGFSTQAVATPVAQVTRADAAAGVSAMLGLTAKGSKAIGDGGSIIMAGDDSIPASQTMARLYWQWVDPTQATRKARSIWSAWDTAEREGIRIEASSTAPMIGFYGGTAVIRGAALTAQLTTITATAPGTPDYAIQDLVQNTGFGFVTADEGQSTLKVVLNLQTRVAELEARLGSATGCNLFA